MHKKGNDAKKDAREGVLFHFSPGRDVHTRRQANHIINNTKTNNQRVTRKNHPLNSSAKLYINSIIANFLSTFFANIIKKILID